MGLGHIMVVLNHLTYRPGWSFHAEYGIPGRPDDGSLIMVRAEAVVPDSRKRGEVTTIAQATILPNHARQDEWTLARFVRDSCIRPLEDHERGEWLRYRGDLVGDPHFSPA